MYLKRTFTAIKMVIIQFLGKQDWFRMILMTAFAAYLVQRIYRQTEMLFQKEMGFTEMPADSKEMKFPSVTLCPASMKTSPENIASKNITADSQNLPRIEEMLVGVRQMISINNSQSTELLIGKDQEGSLSLGCYRGSCIPHSLQYDLKDILELSVGPRDNNDGIKACFTFNPPGAYRTGFLQKRMLFIYVNAVNYEWFVYIHERGHMVHNSMYNFGSALSYTSTDNNTWLTVHEIHRKEVSYINDPRTPCQSQPREEEMNTCIQHYIENTMGCQLPWQNEKTTLQKCTESAQYQEFITAYDEIVSLDGFSIAKKTGCLPLCKRNEFTMNVISRMSYPDGGAEFDSFFYYPGGRYQQKVFYYTYNFTSYIADVGGLVGLFLGLSFLSVYDEIKRAWKNE